MKENSSQWSGFIKIIAISSFIVLVLAVYPVVTYSSATQINSFVCGYVISLLNALLGYKLNAMAIGRSVKSFMILVFGGLGLRILVVVLLLLIMLQFESFEAVSLISSVFFFYVLFISIEIYFLHKKQTGLKTINSNTAI